MQFTTVRSKEKDYDVYLKKEKLVHSNQEHEKNVSQLFQEQVEKTGSLLFSIFKESRKNGSQQSPCYFDKHCCIYLKREKSGSLLFGDKKMQFTTVRSKEKDYDLYLKSEKLVHSNQEHEKNVFHLF